MTPPKWTFRTVAFAGVLAVVSAIGSTPRADAQQPAKVDPKTPPKATDKTTPHTPARPVFPKLGAPKTPGVVFYPQSNSFPGLPAALFNQPAYNPGPYYNPALNNPWMNQTQFIPTNPYTSVYMAHPPFYANPYTSPFTNPFATPYTNPFANPYANLYVNPFAPSVISTPPQAIQQPGYFVYRGPDLQVNPWSGTVYKPLSGVARTADGSTFFRVPGTGLPTVTGDYATGSGLYFDPRHGSFLNPATGVISKPGMTSVFIPWIP